MFSRRLNKKIIDYQNDLISKHCGEVENIYRQMRGWKHDFHNYIQMVKAYISMGEIDKLLIFCDKLDNDLNTIDQVIKTGNVMVDAILNSKISLAKTKKITVNAKATVPKEIEISDVDLCVLIGNLLDNAIEACEKTASSPHYEFDDAFIRIYIGMKGNYLYLCVTNSVYSEIKKTGNKFLSTKNSETHGYGLMRIDKICSKYNGYCKRNNEPGAFSTEILLPVSQ